MTRIKSTGDKGSPCLSPRLCSILSPGEPLSKIWVEEVARSPLTISHQIGPKPRFCITSNKKGQDTESNALVISSFRRIRACFCWCRNFVVCCTSMKLSRMKRPLMKALWFGLWCDHLVQPTSKPVCHKSRKELSKRVYQTDRSVIPDACRSILFWEKGDISRVE